MKDRISWRGASAAIVATAVLAACGGGSGGSSVAANFQGLYAQPLAQMATPATLTSPGLQAAFASSYLDGGMTRPQVIDALGKEAAAAGAPGYSLFPVASLADITITDCSASNVCTVSGTLANNDADETSVTFTSQVVLENGGYRLLGDQKSS